VTSPSFAPKRSLGTQAVVIALSTGVSQVILAVLYLVAARSAGVESYGSVVAAVAAGLATFGLLDFGTDALWVREIAAGRLDPSEYSRRAVSKLAIILVTAVLWAVVIGLLFTSTLYWLSGFFAFAQGLSQTVQTAVRASGRAELAGGAILIDKGVAALVFFGLWLGGADVLVALVLGLLAGPVASGIASNALFLGDWKLRPRLRRPVNPWQGSHSFGIANAAVTARSYDVTLTQAFGGSLAAGTYGAVNRWTQAIELLSSAFSSASAPYMASAPSARAAIRHLRSAMWLPLLAILASVVGIVIAPVLVSFLLGDAYAGSATVLRILAAGTIVSNVNQPLFVFLMARGKDRKGAASLSTGMGITLVLVAVLSPGLGASGAAIAYVCGQAVLLLMLASSAVRLLAVERAEWRAVAGRRPSLAPSESITGE
jgi:O-antigen/teichoic acid export membrane protein